MTTYYYPSTYGAAESPAQNGTTGTATFVGNLPASPAGSYIVVTPNAVAAGATATYTVTFDYTGPGTGITETLSQTSYHNASYNETTDGTYDYLTANMAIPANDSYTFTGASTAYQPSANIATTDPTCFCTGTRIRTPSGTAAVEALRVGDVVVTASGGHRPVQWIGHRTIERLTLEQRPVRILAGAFGSGLPERDLFLSPGHPVLVGADANSEGGHLVPIMCLINGTTIERVPVDEVTYWHVELDEHDILLAEGLPVESYLDWGDRAFFSEASDHALHNPDFIVPGLSSRCRPVAFDGQIVEAERRRLDALFAMKLAAQCSWPAANDVFTLSRLA